MSRSIVAVVGAYVAIGLLVVLTDQLAALMIPGFKSMSMPPLYYFVLSVITDTLYTVLGGYLCSLIARERSRTATIGLIIFGEILGVVSTVLFWQNVPHWFSFALLIVYPPAVWLGYRLRSRATQSVAAAASA